MAQQMVKEHDDLGTADGPRKQPEVEVPPRDPGQRRPPFPVEVILQDRGLPARRPRATASGRALSPLSATKTIVYPRRARRFFNVGHRCRFHCRMAVSSRSNARPIGRWQLQPSLRNSHHTWPGWYWTRHSRSMRSATRHAVHRLVSYPRASGARCGADRPAPAGACARRGPPFSTPPGHPAPDTTARA
jgi:hypothetical protein